MTLECIPGRVEAKTKKICWGFNRSFCPEESNQLPAWATWGRLLISVKIILVKKDPMNAMSFSCKVFRCFLLLLLLLLLFIYLCMKLLLYPLLVWLEMTALYISPTGASHWSKLLDKASFWIQWPNFEARIFIVKWYTKIDQNYCKSNRNV